MTTGPVWNMFELSYSAYLVLHRVALCAMPVEWQERFVELMDELEDTVDTDKFPGSFHIRAKEHGKFIADPFTDYKYAKCPMRPIEAREIRKKDRREHPRSSPRRQADKTNAALIPRAQMSADESAGPVWVVPKSSEALINKAMTEVDDHECHHCGRDRYICRCDE